MLNIYLIYTIKNNLIFVFLVVNITIVFIATILAKYKLNIISI